MKGVPVSGVPYLAGMAWLLLACASAPAEEKLLEGFEQQNLTTTGKVALVKGADAVTQGQSALELGPDATVTIGVPAGAISSPGWLKIDSFQVQPIPSSLRLSLSGGPSFLGHVLPGKDVLALPVSLAARADRDAWPKQAATLEIRNVTKQPVVIDNVRLAALEAAPAGATLLDFGPTDQVLWPGFEPAESRGSGMTWSGGNRIYSFVMPFPDPLLGDFAGPYPNYKSTDAMTIEGPKGGGQVWLYLTHFGYQYSTPLEYQARFNGKVVLHGRLSPEMMLSADGLLEGKDQPWTAEWFQKTYVPKVVSRIEAPANAGANTLELAECQVAALVVAPRTSAEAARTYLQHLEADLERYRRQFVLGAVNRPRCEVPPTEEEAKAGVELYLPPADEGFNRLYVPLAEHRAKLLKLSAIAGGSAWGAVVAVPLADAAALAPSIDSLSDPGKGTLPAAGCRVHALEALPVARDSLVSYQPFLPARSIRDAKARGVYWFLVNVTVPERANPGVYRGTIHVAGGQLPCEIEVARSAPLPGAEVKTFGVFSEGDPFDIFRELKNSLPPAKQAQATREIFTRLFGLGFNAGMVQGPSLASGSLAPEAQTMLSALQCYPAPDRPGQVVVNVTRGMGTLKGSAIQPGTARYQSAVRDLAKSAIDVAGKAGLKDYSIYIGFAHPAAELPDAAKAAAVVRSAGGKCSLAAYASAVAGLGQGQRAELYAAVDTLLLSPDHKETGPIGDAFRKTAAGKTLGLLVWNPDVYACGFYAWGVGADAVYYQHAFPGTPCYNPFWFSGQNVLTLNAQGGFEPTLAMLVLQQAREDVALLRRCEALVKTAKAKGLDTSALEKTLTAIRVVADSTVPSFDSGKFRPGGVAPSQLQDWRNALVQDASWLSQKLAP